VRVNAQGKRLDAWLVYNCASCGNRWNRPILQRRNVRDIEPSLLDALLSNDSDHVRRLAFDVEDLRRKLEKIEDFPDVDVRKQPLNAPSAPDRLEVRLEAPLPVNLRLDRLLANELRLSRTHIEELACCARLRVPGEGERALRRRVKDKTIIEIDIANLIGDTLFQATQSRCDGGL
jgi:hypothetical protein